jgi:hypothetical protein
MSHRLKPVRRSSNSQYDAARAFLRKLRQAFARSRLSQFVGERYLAVSNAYLNRKVAKSAKFFGGFLAICASLR